MSTPKGVKTSGGWSPEAISSEKIPGKPKQGYLKPFSLTSQFNKINEESGSNKKEISHDSLRIEYGARKLAVSCYNFLEKLQRRGLHRIISIIISAQLDLKALNNCLIKNDSKLGSISEQEKEALREILNETFQEEDEITSLMNDIDRFAGNLILYFSLMTLIG